jgi:hypothetical protein
MTRLVSIIGDVRASIGVAVLTAVYFAIECARVLL